MSHHLDSHGRSKAIERCIVKPQGAELERPVSRQPYFRKSWAKFKEAHSDQRARRSPRRSQDLGQVIQQVINFTGTGLRSLDFHSGCFVPEPSDESREAIQQLKKLFEEISESSAETLESLGLDISASACGRAVLDLKVECSNLSELNLDIQVKSGGVKLKFPVHASPSTITSLTLTLQNTGLDWGSNSFRTWIGTSSMRSLCPMAPGISLDILVPLLNSMPFLEQLALYDGSPIHKALLGFPTRLILPNLRRLSLRSLGNGLLKYASIPKLSSLSIRYSEKDSTHLRGLAGLLRSCSSSLRRFVVYSRAKRGEKERTDQDFSSKEKDRKEVNQDRISLPALDFVDLRGKRCLESVREFLKQLDSPQIRSKQKE